MDVCLRRKFSLLQVHFDYITTPRFTVNKVNPIRSPAQCFNAESAAAGENIQHPRPIIGEILQHGKNRAADQVGSGTQTRLWYFQVRAFGSAGNNA
jgi:hypothetical protein